MLIIFASSLSSVLFFGIWIMRLGPSGRIIRGYSYSQILHLSQILLPNFILIFPFLKVLNLLTCLSIVVYEVAVVSARAPIRWVEILTGNGSVVYWFFGRRVDDDLFVAWWIHHVWVAPKLTHAWIHHWHTSGSHLLKWLPLLRRVILSLLCHHIGLHDLLWHLTRHLHLHLWLILLNLRRLHLVLWRRWCWHWHLHCWSRYWDCNISKIFSLLTMI